MQAPNAEMSQELWALQLREQLSAAGPFPGEWSSGTSIPTIELLIK